MNQLLPLLDNSRIAVALHQPNQPQQPVGYVSGGYLDQQLAGDFLGE